MEILIHLLVAHYREGFAILEFEKFEKYLTEICGFLPVIAALLSPRHDKEKTSNFGSLFLFIDDCYFLL